MAYFCRGEDVDRRILLWGAVGGNCLVAATTIALKGWALAAAHLAARNTARFSGLCFLVAFASPGLGRFVQGLPARARWIHAFVAAHMVHFGVVAASLLTLEWAHVAHHPIQSGLIVVLGAALVASVGLTATPRDSRAYTVCHTLLLYLIFLIFITAFVRDRSKPFRALAVFLAISLVLRLTAHMTFWTARVDAQ